MPSVDELLNAAEITEATLTETNDKIEIGLHQLLSVLWKTINLLYLTKVGYSLSRIKQRK